MKIKIWYVVIGMIVIMASFAGCDDNKNKSSVNNQAQAVVDAAHNSRNSLDYEGVYSGVIPCADCSGIYIELTLSGDEFKKKTIYQGEKESDNTFEISGKYTWNDKGSIITLNSDSTEQYQVAENRLIALDSEGKRITGELADMYILKKGL